MNEFCPDRERLNRLAVAVAEEDDVRLALVFGAVAEGRAGADSDLDVAVWAAAPLDAGRRIRLIERLAEVSGRTVELADPRTAGVPVRRAALLKGRKLLCRDEGLHGELLARVLADSLDFLPYRERLLPEHRLGDRAPDHARGAR